jgi:hypothetical protein
MNTQEALDKLADVRAQLDAIELEKQEIKNRILTPELQAQLGAIDAEYAGKSQQARDNAADLEAIIKASIITEGKTVKGLRLMAVWNKGRVTWDSKGVEGFALAHPALMAYRKEGDPTVTIRTV